MADSQKTIFALLRAWLISFGAGHDQRSYSHIPPRNFSHALYGLMKIIKSPGFGEAVNLPQVFCVTKPWSTTCLVGMFSISCLEPSVVRDWHIRYLSIPIQRESLNFTTLLLGRGIPHSFPWSTLSSVKLSDAMPSLSVISAPPTVPQLHRHKSEPRVVRSAHPRA